MKNFIEYEELDPARPQTWFQERHRGIYAKSLLVKDTLFSGKSDFQKIDIIDTDALGKVLLIDGLVMISDREEFVYHEMIAHVPMFTHSNPKRVLIIGGGDGGTLREVIRHPSVEKATMVEIDPLVVDACKEHFPNVSCAMTDPKAEVLIEDGVKYVAETKEKFDVVIVDSTDPIGPAAPLFGNEFYQNVCKILNDDGIVVSQGESPYFELETQGSMLKILKSHFPVTRIYNYSNLTYPGGLWSFTFASKANDPVKGFDPSRVRDSGMEFQYYHAGMHHAAFQIPMFQQRALQEVLSPLE